MLILTLRTDRPEAEIALFEDDKLLGEIKWQAHRQLAETLHQQVTALLDAHSRQLSALAAIGVYEGPGSFTGLRIGLSVANALAYSYNLPMAGAGGEAWRTQVIDMIRAGKTVSQVMPVYGAPVHITPPKK